jgi:D-amino peptidase
MTPGAAAQAPPPAAGVRVYVMTDMEGVAGVVNDADYCAPGSRYYEVGRELTTLETNAAVEGALEAGATDVLVVDGHGHGAIDPLRLHPAARLLAGRPRPAAARFGPEAGPGPPFDVACFVGQHAKANTDGGHLAHTGSFAVEDLTINGRSVGELGSSLLAYASRGVPTVLVAGDAACCAEARELVPQLETVAVKEGLRRGAPAGLTAGAARAHNGAAIHLHPTVARARIREAAARAVRRRHEIPVLRLPPPYELVSTLRPAGEGHAAAGEGPRVARVRGDDLLTVLRAPRHHVPAAPGASRPAESGGAES